MKVKGPMHSIDARGKMGDSFVYSIWRGANTIRGLTVPYNPQSTRQTTIRGFLTDASRAWENLTEVQREAWRTAASTRQKTNPLGQSYYASGLNYFAGLYVLASDAGETPVESVPVTSEPVTLVGAAFAGGDEGVITCTWSGSDGDFVDIWVTPQMNLGVMVQDNMYRHHSYTAIATGTKDITGLVSEGQYGLKVRAIRDNGQAGPFTTDRGAAGGP